MKILNKKDDQLKILQTENEELKKKISEYENLWKRALADYQNLEKRSLAQKDEWITFSGKNIILKLLPVLDNLEKAAEHLKDDGLNLALKHFKSVLEKEGLKEIESLGQTFDPNLHECIDIEEGEEDNKIIKVYEKGYLYNDKIIRPAKVRVLKKSKQIN